MAEPTPADARGGSLGAGPGGTAAGTGEAGKGVGPEGSSVGTGDASAESSVGTGDGSGGSSVGAAVGLAATRPVGAGDGARGPSVGPAGPEPVGSKEVVSGEASSDSSAWSSPAPASPARASPASLSGGSLPPVAARDELVAGPGVPAAGAERTNAGLYDRACRVLPGGVNSPVRSFRSVGGTPYFVARAEGAYVWDIEGRRYLDYVQSYGASVLGHADRVVVQAIRDAALDGTTYGAPTEREVLLAEVLCDRVPGLEMIRLVSSGTEATMSTVRLARGVTGRTKVVKFAGCYHGHVDALLAAGGSGVANQGISGSAGVPGSAVADTVVAPYNVVPLLDDDVALVIVEPVAANMGLVAPAPGFLEGLRAACDQVGALLAFDEVITGFRLARGGAAEYFGVSPDLWCFGKVIGGGLPVGAFGGSRALMEHLAPLGPVYQAGTLSGNPLATAAGLAALGQLDEAAYRMLHGRAEQLAASLPGVIAEAGWEVQVPRVGPLLGIFFASAPVTDYDQARAAADNGRYARFFHAMLARGVAMAPGPYEALFVSLAHSYDDIDRTVDIASAAAHAAYTS